MKKTSIIIITYNHLAYTKDCIESIYQYTEEGTYEIIIIDNFSTDGTREWLASQDNLKIIFNDENLGFPKACNQGIQIASKENDILLLNNDTIVTENWLNNLKTCLYSDDKIGAVGSVCNQNENDQGGDFIYENFNEMQELAKKNNISDSNQWEEKVFLIGFCLLIKREVIEKIDGLDEKYSPGYIEDNDLSLRIIQEGYKLILCHDSFVHHYLGTAFRKDLNQFYPILDKNRQYFLNHWGFSTFCFDEIKDASLKILNKPRKVLELNCGIGPTILKVRYKYQNVVIDGVEYNEYKRNISRHISKIYSSLDEVGDTDYDCILIGNLLEYETNPRILLRSLKKHVTDDGCIIGEISNVSSIENIISLLDDKWYFDSNRKVHNYTITDIKRLVEEEGYKLEYIFSWYKSLNKKEKEIVEKLSHVKNKAYEIVYYSFKLIKKC